MVSVVEMDKDDDDGPRAGHEAHEDGDEHHKGQGEHVSDLSALPARTVPVFRRLPCVRRLLAAWQDPSG